MSINKKFYAIVLSIILFIFSVNMAYMQERSLSSGSHLIINCKTNTMGYYKNGVFVKEFKVATGKASTQTPKGKFKIVNKIKNRPYYSGGIPGGHPNNPLGDRWLGLHVGSTYGTTYGIHGTNNENSIGGNVSGGCIRMYNNDVRWLFDRVPTGSMVVIYSSNESYIQAAKRYNINLSNSDIVGHWAESNIKTAMNNGWVVSSDTFRPNDSITRAEFIKIVNNALGLKEKGQVTFRDVGSSQWFYDHVSIAVKAGYINGYEDNTFRPNSYITREEAASILTKINNNKDENLDKIYKFKDWKNISNWALAYIEGAIESGYMNGYNDNTIKSKSNISRAESIVIVQRSVK